MSDCQLLVKRNTAVSIGVIEGEKQISVVHVILFYTFGVFAFLFFTTNTICHSQSLYYLAPYVSLFFFQVFWVSVFGIFGRCRNDQVL